jgi:hypothetical protein
LSENFLLQAGELGRISKEKTNNPPLRVGCFELTQSRKRSQAQIISEATNF